MVIYTSQISVSDGGVGEQHGGGFVTQDNAILAEGETNDDITDIITCVSEEENGNKESDSSTSEECTSDDDNTGTCT